MTTTQRRPHPLALIILDGWGYRESKDNNAIVQAKTPHWDHWWQSYPHTLIEGSGHSVGLPEGQMGNSEVGHLTMGAGRTIYQDLTRIDHAIETGDFLKNPTLLHALALAKKNKKAVHLMGLLSPGGVHSHEKHFHAAIQAVAAVGVPTLYIHPFLDGRDTPPKSALASLKTLEGICEQYQCGQIASLIGRYYAMDRDKRFERIQCAFELLVEGKAPYHASNAEQALLTAYARQETDEFVQATTISPHAEHPITIQDGEVVLFMNFRADRARELTQAFIDPDFNGFKRTHVPALSSFVSLTEYDVRLKTTILFPPERLTHLLGSYISEQGLKQLRIAETEKYAHVTFFFNGGIEQPSPGEDRILIPSPKVATYDHAPEMSAPEITQQLIKAIQSQQYDVIICNFANADMVGHTGDFAATVQAIETLDTCLGKIIKALQAVGGEAIITADHGNAEVMFDENTQQPHTAHTTDPIPFLYIGQRAALAPNAISKRNETTGTLADIAPTMLFLLNLAKPAEMTGQSLVQMQANQAS
jgi:2,3-bisphosphoglycerate-independent phosphoglycerate mutase